MNEMNDVMTTGTEGKETTGITGNLPGIPEETIPGITLGVPPGTDMTGITALGPGPEQGLVMMICFTPGYMVGDLPPEILMTSG